MVSPFSFSRTLTCTLLTPIELNHVSSAVYSNVRSTCANSACTQYTSSQSIIISRLRAHSCDIPRVGVRGHSRDSRPPDRTKRALYANAFRELSSTPLWLFGLYTWRTHRRSSENIPATKRARRRVYIYTSETFVVLLSRGRVNQKRGGGRMGEFPPRAQKTGMKGFSRD